MSSSNLQYTRILFHIKATFKTWDENIHVYVTISRNNSQSSGKTDKQRKRKKKASKEGKEA